MMEQDLLNDVILYEDHFIEELIGRVSLIDGVVWFAGGSMSYGVMTLLADW